MQNLHVAHFVLQTRSDSAELDQSRQWGKIYISFRMKERSFSVDAWGGVQRLGFKREGALKNIY